MANGIKFRFNSVEIQRLRLNLNRIAGEKGRVLIRSAFRAAGVAPRKHLKGQLVQLRQTSRQSTGATSRAIKTKVIYPIKGTDIGIMILSIDKRYSENHIRTPERGLLSSDPVKSSFLKRRFIGRARKETRFKKSGQKKITERWVKSYQKAPLRRRKGRRHQANIPKLYWHLIESGFRHRSGTRFPGYQFLEKTHAATASAAVSAFTASLSRGLERELNRT